MKEKLKNSTTNNKIRRVVISDKEVKKTESEWHRTFNQESFQWSFRFGILNITSLGAVIILAGVIIWMLQNLK